MLVIKAPFQGGSLGKNEGTDKAPDGVVNELEKCYLAENFSSWRPEVKGLKLDNNNIEVSFQAIEQFIAAQDERFILQSRGSLEVKGRKEPVRFYEVLEKSAREEQTAGEK